MAVAAGMRANAESQSQNYIGPRRHMPSSRAQLNRHQNHNYIRQRQQI
jgi:hypothetical protein